MLVREKNVAQKRKSRAQMSISKIEEIRQYNHERKRIMRSKKKEMGKSTLPDSKEGTVSKKSIPLTKHKLDPITPGKGTQKYLSTPVIVKYQ